VLGENLTHYRITRQLGAGGMGTVYLAHDTSLERDVAIKVLSKDFSLDETHRQRFLIEARSASALNHPNIVTVYEIGNDQGRDFIAMEYIEGQSLKHLIEHGDPLPPTKLLDLGVQLASALTAAHGAGIIHRDLKPANIVMTTEGRAKILDFGLAKRQIGPSAPAGPDDGTIAVTDAISLTTPGMILGTPGYIAPEKARGEEGDHRADLFSLGCILYALATGKGPFSGETVIDVLHSVIHQEPEPLENLRADLPPALCEIVNRCLAKRPRDRYADAGDLEGALREIQAELTHSSFSSASVLNAAPPPARRRPWLYAVAALALVGAVLGGYFLRPSEGVPTTMVVVENEEGKQIQREIPLREYRKRVVVFPFEPDLADTSGLWMTHAVPGLLAQDLLQDYFITIDMVAEIRFAQEALKSGYPGGVGAPLGLKRKAAKDSGCTHFIAGRFGETGDGLRLEVQIYETDSGRLQYRFVESGPDLYALIDRASREVRRELGVPEQHLKDWPDLPVVEVATSSPVALEAIGRASLALYNNNDMAAMRPHLEAAVEADPSYAWALWSLYVSYLYGGDGGEGRVEEVLDALMTHLYRLPERLQYAAKAMYFQNAGDPEKLFLVLKAWADLYPDDNMALESLVQIYAVRGQNEEAFKTLERLLELEPGNITYLNQAATFRRDAGDHAGARTYLEQLVQVAPDDHTSLLALGELEQMLGNHQEARASFEKALALQPKNLELRLALASAEFQLGQFDSSRETLEETLAEKLSPDERLTATTALLRYYRGTGRYGRALEIGAEALAAAQGSAQMMNLIMFEAGLAESHAATGDRDEALAIIEDMRGRLMFPLSILVPIFALEVHLELEDVEPARAAAKELEIAIEEQQWEHLRPIWLRGVGSIHELEGDLEGALANFDGLRELQPTDDTVQYLRARCLRKLGRLDDAQSSMEKALLQRPYAARWLHEAALIAHENGQADLAETHLEHALEIWKNADAEYMPAREARETLASWRQGS